MGITNKSSEGFGLLDFLNPGAYCISLLLVGWFPLQAAFHSYDRFVWLLKAILFQQRFVVSKDPIIIERIPMTK